MAASIDREGLEINMTPLLDLILQLIMFFLITVNFVRADQFDDDIELPLISQAVPLDNADEDWIFLNLNARGQFVGSIANLKLNSVDQLQAHLMREKESLERAAKARGKSAVKIVVVVRADRDCKYGDVWTVVNTCQKAKFKHWQLRVLSDGGT
jgi:biopolymer transport protein ExbD